MKRGAIIVATCAAGYFLHQYYFPARDALIYGCGVVAGQDSILDESRERQYCVHWRLRAESMGFTPFKTDVTAAVSR